MKEDVIDQTLEKLAGELKYQNRTCRTNDQHDLLRQAYMVITNVRSRYFLFSTNHDTSTVIHNLTKELYAVLVGAEGFAPPRICLLIATLLKELRFDGKLPSFFIENLNGEFRAYGIDKAVYFLGFLGELVSPIDLYEKNIDLFVDIITGNNGFYLKTKALVTLQSLCRLNPELICGKLLSTVHVSAIESVFIDLLLNASTETTLKTEKRILGFQYMSNQTKIPVREMDGSPCQEMFTCLNNTNEYSNKQMLNIVTFSNLYTWLFYIYKDQMILSRRKQNRDEVMNRLRHFQIPFDECENMLGDAKKGVKIQLISNEFKQAIISYCRRILSQAERDVNIIDHLSNSSIDPSKKILLGSFDYHSGRRMYEDYAPRGGELSGGVGNGVSNIGNDGLKSDSITTASSWSREISEAVSMEAVRILDLLCLIDPNLPSIIHPIIKNAYERIASRHSSGILFCSVMQFFLNHGHHVIFDVEPVLQSFFTTHVGCSELDLLGSNMEFLSNDSSTREELEHSLDSFSSNSGLATKTFKHPQKQHLEALATSSLLSSNSLLFLTVNVNKLLMHTNAVFFNNFPAILKLVAWHPRTIGNEVYELLPALIGHTSFKEVLQTLIDLPLITSLMEHTRPMLNIMFLRLISNVDSHQVSHIESILHLIDEIDNLRRNEGKSKTLVSNQVVINSSSTNDANLEHQRRMFVEKLGCVLSVAINPLALQRVLEYCYRNECGYGDYFLQDSELQKDAYYASKYIVSHILPISPRVSAVCKLCPKLLKLYFDVLLSQAPPMIIEQVIPILLSRYSRLFPLAFFRNGVQEILVSTLLDIFNRHPHFLLSQKSIIIQTIPLLLTDQDCREDSRLGGGLVLNLCWLIGELINEKLLQYLGNSSDLQPIEDLFTILELLCKYSTGYRDNNDVETSSKFPPMDPYVFNSRFVCVTISAITKLGTKFPQYCPRTVKSLCNLLTICEQLLSPNQNMYQPTFTDVDQYLTVKTSIDDKSMLASCHYGSWTKLPLDVKCVRDRLLDSLMLFKYGAIANCIFSIDNEEQHNVDLVEKIAQDSPLVDSQRINSNNKIVMPNNLAIGSSRTIFRRTALNSLSHICHEPVNYCPGGMLHSFELPQHAPRLSDYDSPNYYVHGEIFTNSTAPSSSVMTAQSSSSAYSTPTMDSLADEDEDNLYFIQPTRMSTREKPEDARLGSSKQAGGGIPKVCVPKVSKGVLFPTVVPQTDSMLNVDLEFDASSRAGDEDGESTTTNYDSKSGQNAEHHRRIGGGIDPRDFFSSFTDNSKKDLNKKDLKRIPEEVNFHLPSPANETNREVQAKGKSSFNVAPTGEMQAVIEIEVGTEQPRDNNNTFRKGFGNQKHRNLTTNSGSNLGIKSKRDESGIKNGDVALNQDEGSIKHHLSSNNERKISRLIISTALKTIK